ncbi:MAG: TRAFs-binding domain-containing protein [Magnetospiraceae bacterium]
MAADDPLAAIDRAMAAGDFLTAYDRANAALTQDPSRRVFGHRAVLALARTGAAAAARDLFAELGLATYREDEDIAGLEARIVKDLALAESGTDRTRLARQSADLYQQAFTASGGFYSLINAATMSLLAGDADAASQKAAAALGLLDMADGSDYWTVATRAEACLLTGNLETMRGLIDRAASLGDSTQCASTRKNMKIIAASLGLADTLFDPLKPARIAHVTGHMMAPPGGSGRFSPDAEYRVAAEITAMLAQEKVGTIYGALASGADILFAEAAFDAGVTVNVVLPFETDDFRRISVAPSGQSWLARFDQCLARADMVTHASQDAYTGEDAIFAYGARHAMGLALLHARNLDTEALQLAVWDGRGTTFPAGTAVDVAAWRGRGQKTIVIAPGPPVQASSLAPADAHAPPMEDRAPTKMRAMLFGDFAGFSKLPDHQIPRYVSQVLGRVGGLVDAYRDRTIHVNSWGDAIYLVFTDVVAAADYALALQRALTPEALSEADLPASLKLRMGLHIGPVYEMPDPITGRPGAFGAQVNKAARIEPVAPPGGIFVSEPFAAHLTFESDLFALRYAGVIPSAKDYGAFRMYHLGVGAGAAVDHAP